MAAQDEKDKISDEEEEMETGEAANDSDSDLSDSEDDGEMESKLQELEQNLLATPFMYDLHVEKISLLRKAGEFNRLRDAREAMNIIFPLTEELWLQWLEDEQKYASENTDRKFITALFDRGVSEYMAVGLWLEYVQYTIGDMGSPDGIQNIRNVFERAITAVGLHVPKGAMIWEAYREFENAIMMGLQPAPGAVSSKEQQDQLDAQTNRITNLFRRQLAVPLQDMTSTFVEYRDWCTDSLDPHIEQIYNRTLQTLQSLQPFETSLLKSEPPHLEAYNSYIDHELARDQPARVQCIFERAIQDNCLNVQLWLKYTKYLVTKLRVESVTLRVYERSVRNCPWCSDLWLGFARSLERHGSPHAKVKELFERALKAGFSQAADYLRVWTGYCDYLRRRISWDGEHLETLEDLRQLFERAISHLSKNFGQEGDANCTLLQYWARIEAKFCKNMTKTRELWNQILQQGFGNQYASWQEYLGLERSFGDQKHCRKILLRAVNSVTDYPEAVCDTYINFEREEGTLEQYDLAVTKCEAQLHRVEERRAKAAEKEADSKKKGRDKKGKPPPKQPQRFRGGPPVKPSPYRDTPTAGQDRRVPPQDSVTTPLRALQEFADNSLPMSNLKRKHEETVTTDADGFKVPALPAALKPKIPRTDTTTESSSSPDKSNTSRKQPPPGYKPKSSQPPPGYKERKAPSAPPPGPRLSDQELVQKLTAEVKEDDEDTVHEAMDTAGPDGKVSSVNDHCTVFVSNLAYDIDEVKLNTIFLEVGELKEVRLVRNVSGKSRGFAYVQFADEFPVQKALKLDRKLIDGRPMFVSPCEQKGTKQNKFKYTVGLERNKLFVKGLPFTTTKDALENIFSQHGTLKSARLVTYKSGAPKGLAYVEYEEESAASQAVLKADGLQIGDHTISVAISNPPDRKAPGGQRDNTFTPTLGSGKRETTDRGKARTQLSLLPRSVQRGPAATPKPKATPALHKTAESSSTSEANGNGSPEAPQKKSNAEFRNMFLSNR